MSLQPKDSWMEEEEKLGVVFYTPDLGGQYLLIY